jgi:protein gp37
MADKTLIAWTDHTFNIAWGCVKVSPGCKHCYAETASSSPRLGSFNVWGPMADRRTFGDHHWHHPLRWNRAAERDGVRRRVFSSSMCDIFEDHPTIERERAKLWDVIAQTPALDWQLLTKRADRIAANLPPRWGAGWPNVWLGVSIENNDYVWRADALRALQAVVLFISYEPALGPLDRLTLDGIDWLIFGGESGPGYRPMNVQWARDIRARCARAGTAFFYKQSAAPRTEMGITLDGEVVRHYPTPRRVAPPRGVGLF